MDVCSGLEEGGLLAKYFFLNPGNVLKEISSWRPRGCTRELDYRDSLYAKLEYAFRAAPTKEFGHGRVRADIAFGTKIGIELKFNLDSPQKLATLVGQLSDYARTFGHTIVVLVGHTDRGLYEDLKKKAKDVRGYITIAKK